MSDPTLAAFHEFARNKSLVMSRGLGPTLDLTRTTEGRVYGPTGLIETVAADVAGFGHDPVTLVSNGLFIGESRINLMLQSGRPTLAPWTTFLSPIINETSAIAPDGTLSAISLNDNNGAGFEAIVQQIPIPNDSATYTFSTYIKKTAAGSAPTMGVNIVLIGGTNPGNLPIPRIFTDTGFIQDLQAGANSRILDSGDYWRLISTVANNSTGHAIIEVQIYPATAANGFLPNIPQAVGINTVWGMQMEEGAFASPYIPTTTAPVARAADVIKTTDISAINTSEGVFYVDFRTGNIDQDTTVLSLDSEIASDRMMLEIINGNIRFKGVAGGDVQWNISTAATADTDYRAAMVYKANDIEFWLNGTQVGVDSLATIPTFTTLHIGCDFKEREQLNEHVRQARHYNIRKPSQFLEDLSNGLISEDPHRSVMESVNVWLALRDDLQALIITRLQWDEEAQGVYTGPVTDRQARLFGLMADRATVHRLRLFRVDTDTQDWTLWNLYFNELNVLRGIKDELDQAIIDFPNQIRVCGAWHNDGGQVGTQFTFDADGKITGVIGKPTYPLHARILELMPDVDDIGTRPTVPSDVNLIMGQTERRFA